MSDLFFNQSRRIATPSSLYFLVVFLTPIFRIAVFVLFKNTITFILLNLTLKLGVSTLKP